MYRYKNINLMIKKNIYIYCIMLYYSIIIIIFYLIKGYISIKTFDIMVSNYKK